MSIQSSARLALLLTFAATGAWAQAPASDTPPAEPARAQSLADLTEAEIVDAYLNDPARLPAHLTDADLARIREMVERHRQAQP